MQPFDTVDRTIRNQRYRRSLAPFWLAAWWVAWTGACVILEVRTPPPWRTAALIATCVAIFASWLLVMRTIVRRPITRLQLGGELRTVPLGRIELRDIAAIRFAADPDEDYAETTLPIALCQLILELRKRRGFDLIVSLGDAARVRQWAERAGIPVIDPEGYSTQPNVREAAE